MILHFIRRRDMVGRVRVFQPGGPASIPDGSGILSPSWDWVCILYLFSFECCLWRRLWQSADPRFREARPCALIECSGP